MHCQIQRISWPAERFYDFVFGGLTGGEFLFWGTKGGLSSEGAKLRLPKARSPLRLGGLGGRRMLRSGGWGGGGGGGGVGWPGAGRGGAARANRRDFEHFKPRWSTFWDPGNLTFLK